MLLTYVLCSYMFCKSSTFQDEKYRGKIELSKTVSDKDGLGLNFCPLLGSGLLSNTAVKRRACTGKIFAGRAANFLIV